LWALGSLPLTEWTNAYPDRRFEEKGGWGITRKWKPKEQNTVGINVQKAHARFLLLCFASDLDGPELA